MRKIILLSLCLKAVLGFAGEPLEEVVLWPEGAPGSEGKTGSELVVTSENGERKVSAIHRPTITPFLPAPGKGNGAAVLVIPGGGHSVLCVDHEGAFVAQWLADHGVAAFVLKHRLAREKGSTYTIEGDALPDTQRALRVIRSRAQEWKIDPARLGAMGFSAGGELVALACMRPAGADATAAEALNHFSAVPAFQALIYPGRTGDIVPEKNAPPAFLACSSNDRKDISEGLAEVYLRFKRAGASAELHVYGVGGHGFGLRPGSQGALAGWPVRFMEWLEGKGFLVAR